MYGLGSATCLAEVSRKHWPVLSLGILERNAADWLGRRGARRGQVVRCSPC